MSESEQGTFTDQQAQPIDRLVAGLLILKAYAPNAEPYSSTKSRRSLVLQEEGFDVISEPDRERLIQLGWWTNGYLVWSF